MVITMGFFMKIIIAFYFFIRNISVILDKPKCK